MNADHLQEFIAKHGVAAELIYCTTDTPTVDAAAAAVGASPDQIVKSLLFLVAGEPTLVVACGTARIDRKRLAESLGVSRKRVKLANAETVTAVSGYDVGAVPPFGHRAALRTVVARRVLDQSEVWAGGGSENALIRLSPAELVRYSLAEIADVAAPNG